MDNIVIGRYIDTNSILHRLDPRTKLISMILLIVITFIINNLITISLFLGLVLLLVLLSKVPFFTYLNGLKPILFIMIFTTIFQLFFNSTGSILYELTMYFGLYNFLLIFAIIGCQYFIRKLFNKHFLFNLLVFFLIVLAFFIKTDGTIFNVVIYSGGVNNSLFLIIRIISLVLISSILTLTTKPMDLNLAVEFLLKPFKKVHLPADEIALMISISLRFIPTLLDEANKIIKAQSSRGVDFKEGSLKSKITQIVSLLIPMFIISFKRADELANAMEARGYVPGKRRTRLKDLSFNYKDYLAIVFNLALFVLIVVFDI